jgi:hypothetical protein
MEQILSTQVTLYVPAVERAHKVAYGLVARLEGQMKGGGKPSERVHSDTVPSKFLRKNQLKFGVVS